MRKFDAWPGVVGLEIRRSNEDGRWIIRRPFRVYRAVQSVRERGVVESIVLGVTSHANVWLGPAEVADVLEQVVGEAVGARVVT